MQETVRRKKIKKKKQPDLFRSFSNRELCRKGSKFDLSEEEKNPMKPKYSESKVLVSGFSTKKTMKLDPLFRPVNQHATPPRTPTPFIDNFVEDEETKMDSPTTVKTGQDAIAFFAMNQDNPCKFLRFNQAPDSSSRRYRPYDLIVAAENEAYTHTMSSQGVSVLASSSTPSSFIPLSQWMKEATTYNVIASIAFFKNYLARKCFSEWRKNVRFKIYCKKRAKLKENLFLASPTFCGPTLELHKRLSGISNVPLSVTDPRSAGFTSKPRDAKMFEESVATARLSAAESFELVLEETFGITKKVLSRVTHCASAFTAGRDIPVTEKEWTEEQLLGDEEDLTFSESKESSSLSAKKIDKTKSIVELKEEAKQYKEALRRALYQESKLGNFFRLIDYIACENVVNVVHASTSQFFTTLMGKNEVENIQMKSNSLQNGVFETSVTFDSNSQKTIFSPNFEAVQENVSAMLAGTLDAADEVPRVIYTTPFKTYCAKGLFIDDVTDEEALLSVREKVNNRNRFAEEVKIAKLNAEAAMEQLRNAEAEARRYTVLLQKAEKQCEKANCLLTQSILQGLEKRTQLCVVEFLDTADIGTWKCTQKEFRQCWSGR
eukprot:g1074.t1